MSKKHQSKILKGVVALLLTVFVVMPMIGIGMIFSVEFGLYITNYVSNGLFKGYLTIALLDLLLFGLIRMYLSTKKIAKLKKHKKKAKHKKHKKHKKIAKLKNNQELIEGYMDVLESICFASIALASFLCILSRSNNQLWMCTTALAIVLTLYMIVIVCIGKKESGHFDWTVWMSVGTAICGSILALVSILVYA